MNKLIVLCTTIFLVVNAQLHQFHMQRRHHIENHSKDQLLELRDAALSNSSSFFYGGINVTFEYTCAITIGVPKQVFIVQMDTGSSNLAIPAAGCGQYEIVGNTLYNLNQECGHADNMYQTSSNSSYIQCTDACAVNVPCDEDMCQFFLSYGDGSWLLGPMIRDILTFGGLSAEITFGEIQEESKGFGKTTVDGIFGLAYRPLDQYTNGPTPFEALVLAGETSDAFSMCMGPNGGMFTLGGVDEQFSAGEMVYTPIIAETYYVVSMEDVLVGNTSIGVPSYVYSSSTTNTIVDSGTTLLYLPSQAFDALQSMFNNNVCPTLPQELKALCYSMFTNQNAGFDASSLHYFPNISIVLNGTGALPLTPQDYFISIEGAYLFGIQSSSNLGTILGDIFMQAYNVLFDRANKRIGFAPVKNCDTFSVVISKVSGDLQSSDAGKSTPQPLVVNVTYPNGKPAVGIIITYESDNNDNFPDSGRAVTDFNGVASLVPVMSEAGEQTINVTASGFEGGVSFTVYVTKISWIKAHKVAFIVGMSVLAAVILVIATILIIRRRRHNRHHYHKIGVNES